MITPGFMLMSGLGWGPWMASGWSWSPERPNGRGLECSALPTELLGSQGGCCRLSSMKTLLQHEFLGWGDIQVLGGFSSVLLLSRVRLFVTPWTAAHQASLSISNSWSLLKLISIESVMPSNHLVTPFSSSRQSFPGSGPFPVSWLLASSGQSIGPSASASVLPMNIHD